MNEQKKAKNQSHPLKPWHADQPKGQKPVNVVSEEHENRDHRPNDRGEEERTMAAADAERTATESRRSLIATFMVKTRVIGSMSAPSPFRQRKKLTETTRNH